MVPMTKIPYPPQRPLSVGEILDLTFQIYRATLVRCLLFSALGVAAGQLTNLYSFAKGGGVGGGWQGFLKALEGQASDPRFWLLNAAAIVLTLVFYAAVLLRQRGLLADRSVGGELSVSLRRTPAMIGLFVLMTITGAACFLPALLVHGVALLGVFLLALLALSYVLVALSSAFIVLLVEGVGPLESYLRSWRLTDRSFWRLSLVYTVGIVVLIVMSAIITMLAALLAAMVGRGDVVLTAAAMGVTVIALKAFTTPFYTALGLAVFGDLTARKEGTDLEQRISATV
jgi:hypothetical protein